MPRRRGYFQKSLVNWFKINQSRFLVPVHLTPKKGGLIDIYLFGQPACINIKSSQRNLCVAVFFRNIFWDALLDLDVDIIKTSRGFRCSFCEPPVKFWQSREQLWADHLFEEFLNWVNQFYIKANGVILFGDETSYTWANLSYDEQSPVLPNTAAKFLLH